jgi:hypothetical protein
MSWDCCTPTGACERGHGCPAGGACHGQAGCEDTRCPGHPGQVTGRHKPAVDLRRVRLDGGDASGRKVGRGALLVGKRVMQLVAAFAVVAIWAAACVVTEGADGTYKPTHMEAT